MNSRTIAALDDEEDILELLRIQLGSAGFQVIGFKDPELFFRHLKNNTPDLVLLDLMLPGMDGIEICRTMKKSENLRGIPIIMLTARAGETDKVLGLEMGADDYITKPFSGRELVARVKAVLRRPVAEEASEMIALGTSGRLDTGRREVCIGGVRIDLTTTEYRILEILARSKGRIYSREKILDLLWGNDRIVTDRTIDVHIRNIRRKLGDEGLFLRNIRGMGYKWES